MHRAIASLLLALGMPYAYACEPEFFFPPRHGKTDLALVGYVTGVRYPDFEAQVLAGEPEPGAQERLLRIAPHEVLRGTPQSAIEVRAPCDWPRPKLLERVVVIRATEGHLLVFSAEHTEAKVREALRNER
jgi:hypothetical protein